MDSAEAPIIRMLAMAIAANACVRAQLVPDNDADRPADSSMLRMLLATACEALATRGETYVSAHGLLASVHTILLVLRHVISAQVTTASTSAASEQQHSPDRKSAVEEKS